MTDEERNRILFAWQPVKALVARLTGARGLDELVRAARWRRRRKTASETVTATTDGESTEKVSE